MTFEEILKSKGWTDADLNDPANKGVLDRMRPMVEEVYGAVAERDSLKSEYTGYRKQVEEEWTPAVNQRVLDAEATALKAQEDAARLKARLEFGRSNGWVPEEEGETEPTPPAFDPRAHKLVTEDDIAKFSDLEGRAIAMASDIRDEYSHLTGKSLFDYTGRDGKRGMVALREEAIQARKPLDSYVAEKFNFSGLRQQKEEEAKAAWERKIREEERTRTTQELASRYGTPNLRPAVPSRQPLVREGETKMPWEQSLDSLRASRRERAFKLEQKVQ